AAPDVIYASHAAYTTCELDHPHYAVEAGRIKVENGETVYTGPVRLRLLGIPMPLWLPFGYFPATEGRRSGPLAVGYGTSADFGLYLEDLGYYWAASDYIGLLGKLRIGTAGSIQADGQMEYNRKYAYDGTLSLSYGRLRRGESDDLDFSISTPARLVWIHNQTFPAGQRLTANVDLQSSSARFVSNDLADQVRQTSISSVTYTQTWSRVGRSLNVQLRADQQLDVNSAQLTLPRVSFSQQRRFPFRRSTRDGRGERWYEQIGISYSGSFNNDFRYTPRADSLVADGSAPSWVSALFSQSAFDEGVTTDINGEPTGERFAYAARHQVPIAANFAVPRYNLTVTPSLTYTENWLNERSLRSLDPITNQIVTETDPGFTFARRIQANLTLSTELFGTTGLRLGPFDGFRHKLAPRLRMAFEPDYARLGTVRTVVDSTGREIRYATVPSIPTDPTASLRFSIDNAFLTRFVRQDSTGEEQRETIQLLALAVSGGYNLAAESRPLEDLRFSANTRRGVFSATATGTFSFYALDDGGLMTDETYLSATGRPARLTDLSFRSGFSLRSRSRRSLAERREPGGLLPSGPSSPASLSPTPTTEAEPEVPYDPASPSYDARAVPVGPWNAGISASFDLTAAFRPATPTQDARWTATVGMNQLSMQLTPKWSLTGSAGFDFIQGEVSQVALALRRDLHCWEMQIRWQPVGLVRSFGVSLYVKSGYLRDLLRLDVPNADFRSAFSNVSLPQ
ncbi:MAG: putative LPS assembly protein LptD, partial [Bacteroidota bacterium]